VFQAEGGQIDLVLMDVVMPKLSGPDAYAKMAALRPEIKVIFTSGYTPEAASLISLLEKGAQVLQKPYNFTSLSQVVRNALDRKPQNVSS
jgi:DNA-binding NtrC family response regulator